MGHIEMLAMISFIVTGLLLWYGYMGNGRNLMARRTG